MAEETKPTVMERTPTRPSDQEALAAYMKKIGREDLL